MAQGDKNKALHAELVVNKGRKYCITCEQERVFEDFVTGNGKEIWMVHECNICRNLASREAEVLARERLVDEVGRKVLAAARGRAPKIEQVHELAACMIDNLGGMDSFCKSWANQFRQACHRSPGTRTVLDAHSQIAHLYEAASKEVLELRRTDDMSDEDMEQELQTIVSKSVKNIVRLAEVEHAAG